METATIETDHKPLIPIAEYAARNNISRRTADRYVRQGKVQSIRQGGKTMIIDMPIAQSPILTDGTKNQTDSDRRLGQLARLDDNRWFELGALTVKARVGQTWKKSAIVLIVLLVVSIAAGVSAAGWFYMSRQITIEQLDQAHRQTVDIRGDLVSEQTAAAQTRQRITALETELDQARKQMSAAQTKAGDIQQDLTATIITQADRISELSKQLTAITAELQTVRKTAVSNE